MLNSWTDIENKKRNYLIVKDRPYGRSQPTVWYEIVSIRFVWKAETDFCSTVLRKKRHQSLINQKKGACLSSVRPQARWWWVAALARTIGHRILLLRTLYCTSTLFLEPSYGSWSILKTIIFLSVVVVTKTNNPISHILHRERWVPTVADPGRLTSSPLAPRKPKGCPVQVSNENLRHMGLEMKSNKPASCLSFFFDTGCADLTASRSFGLKKKMPKPNCSWVGWLMVSFVGAL
jgi:hypothetical protein